MKFFVALLSVAVLTCHAQTTPAAPTIKGHTLGESLQQFIAESSPITREQMQNCSATNGRDGYGDTISACTDYLLTVKTGNGSFDCTLPMYELGTCRDFRGKVTFSDNKLVELNLEITDQEWGDVLPYVVTKFGKPDETRVDTVQNAYGAKFDLQKASWTKPDYLVVAFEKINLPYNLKKFVEINLIDRSYFQSQQAKKAHGNALD
jgi:hypothetical protein